MLYMPKAGSFMVVANTGRPDPRRRTLETKRKIDLAPGPTSVGYDEARQRPLRGHRPAKDGAEEDPLRRAEIRFRRPATARRRGERTKFDGDTTRRWPSSSGRPNLSSTRTDRKLLDVVDQEDPRAEGPSGRSPRPNRTPDRQDGRPTGLFVVTRKPGNAGGWSTADTGGDVPGLRCADAGLRQGDVGPRKSAGLVCGGAAICVVSRTTRPLSRPAAGGDAAASRRNIRCRP